MNKQHQGTNPHKDHHPGECGVYNNSILTAMGKSAALCTSSTRVPTLTKFTTQENVGGITTVYLQPWENQQYRVPGAPEYPDKVYHPEECGGYNNSILTAMGKSAASCTSSTSVPTLTKFTTQEKYMRSIVAIWWTIICTKS